MSSFPDVLCGGAMLGGLLALTGSWSRGARAGLSPHLAVGAVICVGTAAIARFPDSPALALAVAILGGGACGAALELAQRRLDTARFPLAADIAGLAAVLGLAALLAPVTAGPRTDSVLTGDWPPAGDAAVGALILAGIAVFAAVLLARVPATRLGSSARWAAAGAAASGLGAWAGSLAVVPSQPGALALALAAAVVGLLARGPLTAIPAGLVVGIALVLADAAGLPAGASVGVLLLAVLSVLPGAHTTAPEPA